jgi:hypothetical protein
MVWQSNLLKKIPWLEHGTSTRDFSFDRSEVVLSGNVHGNKLVPLLTKEGLGVVAGRIPDCDGLLTDIPNLKIGTTTADCLPIFFVDPTTRTVAVVHAGWRGIASGIAIEAVRLFVERGSNPADLLVAIGPSIGVCHYQIHPERRDEMLTHTPSVSPLLFKERSGGGYFVDLRGIISRQLISSGVLLQHIDASAPCTVCRNDLYYSYFLTQRGDEMMMSMISIHNDLVDNKTDS